MLPYRHEIQACFGTLLNEQDFTDYAERAAAAARTLLTQPSRDAKPILALPKRKSDLEDLDKIAEGLRRNCKQVVVLGTGGSSLGGQTLVSLANRGFGPKPGTPLLHFMDNVDPDTLGLLAGQLDPMESALIIISKSGTTVETLSQALALLPGFLKLSVLERAARVIAITEVADSPLGRLAIRHGFTLLPHEPDLGGRFTALSSVGLLPALIAGLDGAAVRTGAAEVMQALVDAPETAAPVQGAAVSVALMERGASQQILMPYCDRLGTFGFWYRQLWAESLGKEGKGQTPIRALGTVDQHSQLQLYLDGPRDKAFTLLRGETRKKGAKLDVGLVGEGLEYLTGRTLGDLLDAEARATGDTIKARGLPLREFVLPTVDERALGALFQHFILETILAAGLMGISPFGQPAVEEGKVLARRYLQEMGQVGEAAG